MSTNFFRTVEGRYVLSNLVSVEDDLSDVSLYFQKKGPASVTEYTLLDIADGPKTCLVLAGQGNNFRDTAATKEGLLDLTIDGTSTLSLNPGSGFTNQDQGSSWVTFNVLPQIRYDSTFRVDWEHTGTGNYVNLFAKILGSGPHSAAVVRDGEPVYMTAVNLSETTIEGMGVPEGYRVVMDPEIDHPNPQTRGSVGR